MTERPCLMSDAMVRRTLDGTKTQTRRIFFAEPDGPSNGRILYGRGLPRKGLCGWQGHLSPEGLPQFASFPRGNEMVTVGCPYGAPGDRLWVRETWASTNPEHPRARVAYRADFTSYGIVNAIDINTGETTPNAKIFPEVHWPLGPASKIKRWRPSIHMPRWASRIDLEIVSTRVEQLQRITEADAQAEGARHFPDLPLGSFDHGRPYPGLHHPPRWSMFDPLHTGQCLGTARFAFGNAWDIINGKHVSWASNPWVWVICFRVVTAIAERKSA